MKFKILDLFSGAGGFSSGLEKNKKFKTLLSLDIDQNACKTFKENFPYCNVVCGSIDNNSVKEKIINLSKKLKINMIVGGPPCQGFSLKGKNLGINDSRNFLFKHYIDIVKEVKPEVFVIENVKNILNSSNHYFKNQIISEINELGYFLNFGVLNAKNYGVPQNRERAFFIASKTRLISFPKQFTNTVTVRDAISDLSYLESGAGTLISKRKISPKTTYQKKLMGECIQFHIASKHSKLAIDKLKMIPAEKGKEFLPKELHGKQKFSTTWSRLVWDDVSPTIDTRFDTPSNGRNSHPFLNRAITPREAACLQSFDDDFWFMVQKFLYVNK